MPDELVDKAIDKILEMRKKLEDLGKFSGKAQTLRKFKESVRYLQRYKVHPRVAMLILKERKDEFYEAHPVD